MSSIDVIVPCYRYGTYLDACVRSILAQEGVDLRVLIMDDASPDDTPRVASALQKQDGRVYYRRHERNCGHIATYNEALDWVEGDYVFLISADDLVTPGALGRAVRALDACPGVALAYGRDVPFTSEPLAYEGSSSLDCPFRIIPYRQFLEDACRTGHTPIQAPAVIARTKVHRRVGYYRTELPHTADTELWLRLASHGGVIALDGVQAWRRIHGHNMSFEFSTPERLQEQMRAIGTHLSSLDPGNADASRFRMLLESSMSEKALWSAVRAFESGDDPLCETFSELALEFDCAARRNRIWRQLRIRRLLGRSLWRVLQHTRSRTVRAQTGS